MTGNVELLEAIIARHEILPSRGDSERALAK
jgi:hypothetical protein